jgi:anthranilate/para-aminobenzoate synthase component I
MEVDRFSHVMHLVSVVTGRLREDVDALDAFAACFPAGTVSGAPKIRAMELIEELETVRRARTPGPWRTWRRARRRWTPASPSAPW